MKRFIAAVSFAAIAAPALAQSSTFGPTDAVGPAWLYEFNAGPSVAQTRQDRTQVASSGATRSDVEISTQDGADAEVLSRHVELQPGYFDPGQ